MFDSQSVDDIFEEMPDTRNSPLKATDSVTSVPNSTSTGVQDLPDTRDMQKRKNVLNEIYETEKTYQHQLKIVTTVFLEPVKFSCILAPQIVESLFSNIEAIHSVSKSLVTLMEEKGVVHSLLELAPYMKLYSIYANNFSTSAKLLEELQSRSEDFRRLLKYQEGREEMESQTLGALLLTPIQRVPRYRLLLENLLEKTSDDDPNLPKLKGAFSEIEKVANHINECVRQHENFNKMLTLQNLFIGANAPQVLSPGRYFIRQGDVQLMSKKGKPKERKLILFNDLLVCAKKESGMYLCIDVYPIFDCIVEQLLGSSDDGTGLFKVINGEGKYLLLCSKDGKGSWVPEIKEAISKVHANYSSLKRGSFVTSARSYETLKCCKGKPKLSAPKSVTPKRGNGILDFKSNSVLRTPVYKTIANQTSLKRGSMMVGSTFSVYDVCRKSANEDDPINTSINSISSFVRNNSFLFDTTETEEEMKEPEKSFIPVESDQTFVPTGDWTVTEKTVEHLEDKSCGALSDVNCTGKRKDDCNTTAPYTKRTKVDKGDENHRSVRSHNSENRTPVKNSNSTETVASCSLM